jgi:hypothetical protein
LQRVFALGDRAARDVTIGDDAQRLTLIGIIDDGNGATVVFDHHLRDALQTGFRRAAGGIPSHDVFNSHSNFSSVRESRIDCSGICRKPSQLSTKIRNPNIDRSWRS